MSNIDSTTVTIVIAVAAFVSPVITTALNIWLQLHLRKMDLQNRVRRDAVKNNCNIYERYLRHAGKCVKSASWDDMATYGDAFALAYAYAPDHIRKTMLRLDHAISATKQSEADNLLPEVSAQVASVLYHPDDHVSRKNKHAIYAEK